MIHPLTVRVSVLAMSIALAISAHASVTAVTETVKGRKPVVTEVQIHNRSAPGLNPAQGDELETTYIYTDPDGTPEDFSSIMWSQSDGGTISGSEGAIFVPGAEQLDSTLRSSVTAWSQEPSDPLYSDMIVSEPTAAPVLPPRAEFDSLYHLTNDFKRWGDAYMYCAGRGERLMTTAELQELFVTYTRATAVGGEYNSDIRGTYGYGLGNPVWTKDGAGSGGDTHHKYVYIQENGRESSNANNTTVPVGCAKFGTPEGLPTVSATRIIGVGAPGQTLTFEYIYQGNDTIPDRSRFQWYRSASAGMDGREPISGATAQNYELTPDDAGKYISADITPASYDTVAGATVTTAKTEQILGQDLISDVTILKPTEDNPYFEASYTYNGGADPEQGTTYRWYWKGTLISGSERTFAFDTETYPSHTQTDELRVEIVPRSASGMVGLPKTGTLGLRSPVHWYLSGQATDWYEMSRFCATSSLDGRNRPAPVATLQSIVNELGNIQAYGFQNYGALAYSAWTGTSTGYQAHQLVDMKNGDVHANTDNVPGAVLCVEGSVPTPNPDLVVNGYKFAFNSGFPTTGFNNAYFQIDGQNTDTIALNSSVATVDSSNRVTLKSKGSASFEIWSHEGGLPATLNFNVTKWFRNAGVALPYSQAARECGDSDYNGGDSPSIPPLIDLSPYQQPGLSNPSRRIGSLWGEWGDVSAFGWSFPAGHSWYWAGSGWTSNGSTSHNVSLQSGSTGEEHLSEWNQNVVCKG